MNKRRTWILVLAGLSAVLAGVALACSGPADDGASCSSSSDCKSKVCDNGQCGGSSCSCTTDVCTNAPECQSGWACVRESTGAANAFPVCRRLCADGKGCAPDEHCSNDGVCHLGAEGPVLAWKGIPRRTPCAAFEDCPFEVDVTGGSGSIDHFTWSFDDDAGTLDTPGPSLTHKYGPGQHTTAVTAFDKNGTQGNLSNTDDICVDGQFLSCVEGLINCCAGSCTPDGGCF